jgi:hypothetical protein
VEAELHALEGDYEVSWWARQDWYTDLNLSVEFAPQAKREHAQNQTLLLAEKTQELNDLRAQKAADDVSRAVMG